MGWDTACAQGTMVGRAQKERDRIRSGISSLPCCALVEIRVFNIRESPRGVAHFCLDLSCLVFLSCTHLPYFPIDICTDAPVAINTTTTTTTTTIKPTNNPTNHLTIPINEDGSNNSNNLPPNLHHGTHPIPHLGHLQHLPHHLLCVFRPLFRPLQLSRGLVQRGR
ncbi:hypothetical protein SMACR_06665 [Sordaria macrospora]|uniref:Uncharacterized protein n=1 Tax=Sordaria macrospora TaxID=5147 RepID=A0A8S8ZU89_SORMA|nr:hypothetical protein SMACR_06665 [Sordaria macrospora]WPJ62931.1 hypothetical protein SMAC4_06665 [Sordaria macrospora]